MEHKIIAPLTVEDVYISKTIVRNIVGEIIRRKNEFVGMDLIKHITQIDSNIHFQQEVTNRLLQRWRRLGLISFKSKKWKVVDQQSVEMLEKAKSI